MTLTKIITASILALTLTGCAPLLVKLYDSYFLAPYDNIEYAIVNRSSPVQVGSGTTWSNISIGNYNTIATKQV